MSIIKSMVIAFSMYSKIPMPHLELDEKDMKYVMGFFPLIGLITGTLVYGWIYAGKILYVPDISRTLVLIILPVIITGGIHVDGYMDTCDALNSYGDREKKLAILRIRILVHLQLLNFWFIMCCILLLHLLLYRRREICRLLLWHLLFICRELSADWQQLISAVQEITECFIHLQVLQPERG